MLCDVCDNLNFEELLPLEKGIDSSTCQHAAYSDLEVAAKDGCELCRTIERFAIASLLSQPARYNHLRRFPVVMKMHRQGRTDSQYQGASKLYVTCGGLKVAQFEVYVPPESEVARSELKLISGRLIALDSASDETFSVARSWLRDCMTSEEHALCRGMLGMEAIGETSATPMPTRLIDVGPSNIACNPRLVLSSTLSESGSKNYAALSHCWEGAELLQLESVLAAEMTPVVQDQSSSTHHGPKPLTTLIGNLNDRMSSIPLEILPKTFRDASLITRKLGLRYIWIDSLCIIQDSAADWEQEAARMASIYKNSYVTIAAESARDSHAGILLERHLDYSPISLPLKSPQRNINATVYLRQVQDDWKTCITGSGSALRSRAWVLQESMLAPRTIHFSSQQMFWECKTLCRAEGDVTPIPPPPKHRTSTVDMVTEQKLSL